MNTDKLVEVEFNNPERAERNWTFGELREGSRHILIIYETVLRADLYSYTIIPRGLINKVTELRVTDE